MPDRPHRLLTHRFRPSVAAAVIAASFAVCALPAASASAAVRSARPHIVHVQGCSNRCKKCLPPIC